MFVKATENYFCYKKERKKGTKIFWFRKRKEKNHRKVLKSLSVSFTINKNKEL